MRSVPGGFFYVSREILVLNCENIRKEDNKEVSIYKRGSREQEWVDKSPGEYH